MGSHHLWPRRPPAPVGRRKEGAKDIHIEYRGTIRTVVDGRHTVVGVVAGVVAGSSANLSKESGPLAEVNAGAGAVEGCWVGVGHHRTSRGGVFSRVGGCGCAAASGGGGLMVAWGWVGGLLSLRCVVACGQ